MDLKRGVKVFVLVLLIFIAFNSFSALAGDQEVLLMDNNHDALIIGEITEITEDGMLVQVEKQIINPEGGSRKQIHLDGSVYIDKIDYYRFYIIVSEDSQPQKGDYILASLDKRGAGFKDAQGIYKVNSKDYKSLSLVIPEHQKLNSYSNLTIAALNRFVNSDGMDCDFSYRENSLYLRNELIYEYKPELLIEGSASDNEKVISTSGNSIDTKEKDEENLLSKSKLLLICCGAFVIVLGVILYRSPSSKEYR